MAAYAAVISLKRTINRLLINSSSSSPVEILGSAHDEATSLQQVLERLNERSRSSMERVDALEGQIRDFANKLEDFLEFHELKLEEVGEEVRREISSFAETAKKTAKDYMEELSREEEEEEDDDDRDAAINISDDFGVEMVGRSEEFTDFQKHLLGKMRPVDLCFYSVLGEKGSGRTKFLNAVYEDLSKCRGEYFDCWAWVTVGRGPTKHDQVLMSIISQVVQVGGGDDASLIISLSEDVLSEYLLKGLENRRYMIVLDDVDDVELVEYLKRTSFPDESNGSLVLLTTTSNDVAQLTDDCYLCKLPFRLFQESLWPPLRTFLFGSDPNSISPEMEEAGKQIIKNCRCLLIVAAKVYLSLSKAESTLEQWSKIAADEENPIFMVADELSEISNIKAEIQSWDMSNQSNRIMVEMISAFVDFPSEIEYMKTIIHPKRLFSKMQIVSILGMAGIGKTTFIEKVFRDWLVRHHFDHHVWITLGPKYRTGDILMDILGQIYPTVDRLHIKADGILTKDLCAQVSHKRCLIVLDNLCSSEPLFCLNNLFPDIKGTTLVTTRLAKVAKLGTGGDIDIEMLLLDKEESWCLLRQKVFFGESCPPELEKVGHMIAEKCDGLPLLILTVADQLLKVERSEKFWMDVASGKEKSIFKNAHNQISEALLPSYQNLPQCLKQCFLYLGIFREKFEIPTSNLTHLCISEGFLEPNSQMSEDFFIVECLSDLVDTSLLIVERKVFDSQIKTCRLHSIFWHLSNSQAVKNKFFHAMNSYGDCSIENVDRQRRLCIRNSILLGMKDVQKSMASNTSAHSLLCVGPFHQFPVSLNFDFMLLRVMNVVTVRLYEFPDEVVRLLNLRYLAVTCNGVLPSSISKLWKLQYLIVKRYVNIKSSQNSSHLPVEIWDMKELKHLEVTGGCLPNRKSGRGLLKLRTLLDVSAESCKKKVFKWIPNLQRLSIRIELGPSDGCNYSFRCLNRIHRLRRLESLKCVVTNPRFGSEDAAPPAPLSMFPRSLKKLSLSGLGYPWEYMTVIGKLENLVVLKLKRYAFRGPKWEIDQIDHSSLFAKLKFLLIENTNLIQWKSTCVTKMMLDCLRIEHCYTLQELPASAPIGPFTRIQIEDCSPLIVTWAENMEQAQCYTKLQVRLSWIDDITKN